MGEGGTDSSVSQCGWAADWALESQGSGQKEDVSLLHSVQTGSGAN
jgi:hypothetical protein